MSDSVFKKVLLFFSIIYFGLLLWSNLKYPLIGPHWIRQADTLFSGYSYCVENTPFLKPTIAHREATSGVSIGELPLFSYVMSIPCQLNKSEWDFQSPRILNLVIFIIMLWVWFLAIPLIFKKKIDPLFWVVAILFSPVTLVYLTMPIPDSMALLFLGLGYLSLERFNRNWIGQLLFSVLFTLSFLMRPYFFPLILFNFKNWRTYFWTMPLLIASYWLWYKWWVPQHTEIFYYATEAKSPLVIFEKLNVILLGFWKQLNYSHLNYVGLLLIPLFFKNYKLIFAVWLAAFAFVIGIKADHFVVHAYYFIAAGFVGAIMFALLLSEFNFRFKKIFTILFVLIGISSTQHHFLSVPIHKFELANNLRDQTQPSELIAMYSSSFNPSYFYLSSRMGWILPLESSTQPCPEKAIWKWTLNEDNSAILNPCSE